MEQMTPFEYVNFWDVPLDISIRHRGIHFVFQRPFDDDLDEYPDFYTIWIVRDEATDLRVRSPGFWKLSMDRVGELPVRQVKFDEERRKELDASVLDRFIDAGS